MAKSNVSDARRERPAVLGEGRYRASNDVFLRFFHTVQVGGMGSTGEVFVSHFWRDRTYLRPLIAAASAYVLVLQVLISGLGGALAGASDELSLRDLLILCQHNPTGAADAAAPDGTKAPQLDAHCPLCTAAHGIDALAAVHFDCSFIVSKLISDLLQPRDERAAVDTLPIVHHARGPPVDVAVFG
jgi:hypothetical protein